jgi:PIN domain nuclease of toxin-antitoxin system
VKLLLDTHILLWSVFEPERLSRRISQALMSSENELWLSSASVWEIVLLERKGRIELNEDVATWVKGTVDCLKLNEAPITFEVALESDSTGLAHSDPGDRFLVASAKVFDLTLVTADDRLYAAPGISILPNR